MSAEHLRKLHHRVLGESKTVTYRLASRLLNVHVDTARSALQAFWDKTQKGDNANKVQAMYLVSGVLRPPKPTNGHSKSAMAMDIDQEEASDDDMPVDLEPAREDITIMLVPLSDLDRTKQKFSKIASCYMYSIAPANIADVPTSLMNAQLDLQQDATLVKSLAESNNGATFGIIKHHRTNLKKSGAKPSTSKAVAKPAAPAAKPGVKRKSMAPSEAPSSTSKGKGKAKIADSEEDEPKPSGNAKGKGKASGVDDMDLDDMLMDDDEMMAEINRETPAKKKLNRKTRKVIKSRTVTVEDTKKKKTYRKTEDYETDESYYESDGGTEVAKPGQELAKSTSKPKVKPAPAPAPVQEKPKASTTTNNGAPAEKKTGIRPVDNKPKPKPTNPNGQTSLKNFFKAPTAKKK